MTEGITLHFDNKNYHEYLLSWFFQYGRHNLPWQGQLDPYKIWISEIMLQQTQVKTVIPYFLKFLKIFPTIDKLSLANQDKVMQYWAGLGYYTRARNLHKASQIICKSHNGVLPSNIDDLLALPGIGKSTAHAILSIAFGESAPILDANVKRIFLRLFSINSTKFSQYKLEKILWNIADELMPQKYTQAYTQAQMDLGAIICTNSQPKCNICPLNTICMSFINNQVDRYPLRRKLTKVKSKCITTFFLYKCNNQVLLIKKPNHGIWGGLYSLPEHDLKIGEYSYTLCNHQKHTFTHLELYYNVKVYQVLKKNTIKNGHWVLLQSLTKYALPVPIRNAFSTMLKL